MVEVVRPVAEGVECEAHLEEAPREEGEDSLGEVALVFEVAVVVAVDAALEVAGGEDPALVEDGEVSVEVEAKLLYFTVFKRTTRAMIILYPT